MQNNKTIMASVVFKTCGLLDFSEAPPVSFLLEQRYIAVSTEGSAADLETLNEPPLPPKSTLTLSNTPSQLTNAQINDGIL